jgi:acyl-ACP thioesterase
MVIHLERKQPLKIDDILPDFVLDKRALDDPFASLPVLEKADREVPFPVEMDNLDLNRHVNNAVYVRWALESVPAEVLAALRPVELEVAYRAEALYGDSIIARTGPAFAFEPDPAYRKSAPGNAFLHQIVNSATGVELTRLRSRWE